MTNQTVAEKPQADGELTLVGTKTVINGKVTTEGSIRIDGKLIGDVMAKANAAIGETGVIEGTVQAKNISVAGKVSGAVLAAGKVLLGAKSVMRGEIRASKLVVDEGAVFDGKCAMTTGPAPELPRT